MTRSSTPRFASPLPEVDLSRALKGAKVTGHTLTGPQLQLARLIDAPHPSRVGQLFTDPVVLLPRRVGKTTSIFAVLVGRCLTVPGYMATYVAQSGVKSRERFVTLKRELETNAGHLSGWKTRDSRGEERIEFSNGSVLKFFPPKQESFRGDGGDVVVLDESQEINEAEAGDLVGAILPLFDTRPGGGQLIVAGTAGERRGGLLWEALVEGRAGRRGILEYSAPDTDDVDPEDDDVLLAAHPGIGTLTTLEIIRERRDKMDSGAFSREYLGIWPKDAAAVGLTLPVWEDAGSEESPLPQTGFGLAFAVNPDRTNASVAATWTDADGLRRVELVDARPGTAWLVPFLTELLRARRVPLLYNAAGGALDIAAELAVTRPKPDLRGLTTAQYTAACAGFVASIVDGRLVHHRQPQLTDAVAIAGRRRIGDGLWGWGNKVSGGDISALEAATVSGAADAVFTPKRARRILSATG